MKDGVISQNLNILQYTLRTRASASDLFEKGVIALGGNPDYVDKKMRDNNIAQTIFDITEIDQKHVDEFFSNNEMIDHSLFGPPSQHAMIFIALYEEFEMFGEKLGINHYLADQFCSLTAYDISVHSEFLKTMSHAIKISKKRMTPKNIYSILRRSPQQNKDRVSFYRDSMVYGIDPKLSANLILFAEIDDFKRVDKNFSEFGYTNDSLLVIDPSEVAEFISYDISFLTAFRFHDAGYLPEEASNYIDQLGYDKNQEIANVSWYRSFMSD